MASISIQHVTVSQKKTDDDKVNLFRKGVSSIKNGDEAALSGKIVGPRSTSKPE
jgi:hypothetical protein